MLKRTFTVKEGNKDALSLSVDDQACDVPRGCVASCAHVLPADDAGKKRQRLNEETGHNSEWILKKKKVFVRHPCRACSPNQSPLDRVVTATCSSLGELCWETFTCRYHRKTAFHFWMSLDAHSSLYPSCFSFFCPHHLPICFITELQLLFIYLDINLYNWNIGFPAATKPDLMAKNVPDHFVRKMLVKCGTIYSTFVTRIQSVRLK